MSDEQRRMTDDAAVNHPKHYGGDVPHEAIKCIAAWGLNFALGNAVKYINRAGKKPGEEAIKDLRKALWYLTWEIRQHQPTAKLGRPDSACICSDTPVPDAEGLCSWCGGTLTGRVTTDTKLIK